MIDYKKELKEAKEFKKRMREKIDDINSKLYPGLTYEEVCQKLDEKYGKKKKEEVYNESL